jgi:hypothetical protein
MSEIGMARICLSRFLFVDDIYNFDEDIFDDIKEEIEKEEKNQGIVISQSVTSKRQKLNDESKDSANHFQPIQQQFSKTSMQVILC